ncbi:uncharacterized protein DEA37_0000306 [Paragonimus westermani]|uniref:Uncharacterized protein n=1 Tax=Paragonimus westermani TaxID=34504 RepID=A0A5J4NYC9_9TREM|nr:uncharacterized protein DEA37_0000306 [Paragonimus westermani]
MRYSGGNSLRTDVKLRMISRLTTITCLLLHLTMLEQYMAVLTSGSTCPLADSPAGLGSGSLDQLVDVLLTKLFNSSSAIKIEQLMELTQGVELGPVTIYNLQSIRRTCGVQLTTQDSVGCNRRGLLLDGCFGFDNLQLNASITSWIPGLRNGDFLITLKAISLNTRIELFSTLPSGKGTPTHSRVSANFQVARIVQLQTNVANTGSSGLTIRSIKGGVGQKMLTWFMSLCSNLFTQPLLNRVDWSIKRALNEQLRTFELAPLFVPTRTITIWPDKPKKITKTSSVIQEVPEPTAILALPLA